MLGAIIGDKAGSNYEMHTVLKINTMELNSILI